MRAILPLAVLLVPLAAASGYTLGADRTIEAELGSDGTSVFAMPLHVEADGSIYAKMLGTPDNAATSEPGWNVSYALDATALEEATPVPVLAGEDRVFRATVVPPAEWSGDARVYVALAYRAPASGGTGDGASGATQDEARALTLILRAPGPAAPPDVSPIAVPRPASATPEAASDAPASQNSTAESKATADTPMPAYVPVVAIALVALALARVSRR